MSRNALVQPVYGTPRSASDAAECRCHCGSLLARRVPGGVEIKCRGCKRLTVLPLASDDPDASELGSER